MTTEEKIAYERWAHIQEMNLDDVMTAIVDCLALVDAIKNRDYDGIGQLVKTRIDLKAQRIAELRVLDTIVTPWLDQGEERANYQMAFAERVETMFRRKEDENQGQLSSNFGGFDLSKVNRAAADLKTAEAEAVAQELEALRKEAQNQRK